MTVLAQGVAGSNPLLNITIFALFVVATLVVVVRVSRRATSGASDFYTAGGGFSGRQNGIAISGDYLSAASFLGIAIYTVPTAREARRSVVWAIGLIGLFYLFTLVLGYGAGALVGPDVIKKAPGGANSAAPLLAFELGGTLLLAVIAAVAFATILAVVAGLTITGVVAILGGILANGQNIAFLVALAFAVAASANLPTILYSLFWARFTTNGALWSIYGGLGVTVLLIVFSPVVSGKPIDPVTGRSPSMLQSVDFHWFPLDNPGIVSIPLSFLLGYLGTVWSKGKADTARFAEMEVRSLTGVGVEPAAVH